MAKRFSQSRWLSQPFLVFYAIIAGVLYLVLTWDALYREWPMNTSRFVFLFNAELHSHLTYVDSAQSWKIASEVRITTDDEILIRSNMHMHDVRTKFDNFKNTLIEDGWTIDAITRSREVVPLTFLDPKERNEDPDIGIVRIDRKQDTAIIETRGLDAHKDASYPEEIKRWHVSRLRDIPLLPLSLHVNLSDKSDLILDVPKDMVLATLPESTKSEDLIINNYVRMHIPLDFAFDGRADFTMKIAYPTAWAKTVKWLSSLGTKSLAWLLGALATLIGGIVLARITKLTDRIRKRLRSKPPAGFGRGAPINVKRPRTKRS